MDHGSLMMSGTPGELKDSLHGDVLTLNIEDGGKDVTEFLKSLPNVTEVSRTDDTYRLKLPKVESALPEIITSVASKGLKIAGTSFSKPSLDQVFLEVTGRSMRDAEENGRSGKFGSVHARENLR